MTTPIPPLRLGLAGFDEARGRVIRQRLQVPRPGGLRWEVAPFHEADAWWLCGARVSLTGDAMVRVPPGLPSERAIQLTLAEVDRPVAFSLPLAPRGFTPACVFDLGDGASVAAALHRFEAWMQPLVAQFCLAASLVREQPALGAGPWEVLHGGRLVAVVDQQNGTAVAPDATPADFAEAIWCVRDWGTVRVPAPFVRASLSQLMWQFALRTESDLLPPHYRERPLYFRRPPKLPQRLLADAHLLLLRELAARPGLRFDQLAASAPFSPTVLARHLAALYYVGAITANPRRAAPGLGRRFDSADSRPLTSVLPSELESAPASEPPPARPLADFTAPAPLRWE
ncbi:hypothetical protein [Ramlibacter sp.]|uniref:hypothetical protein n=1 Tax=Ramlibacter sp. TaxID=1917967 RepID=UPI0035B11785